MPERLTARRLPDLICSVLRPGVILARIKNTKDCAIARTDEQETSFNNCGREPDYHGPPHFSGRCGGLQGPPMSHKIGISSRVTEKRSDMCQPPVRIALA